MSDEWLCTMEYSFIIHFFLLEMIEYGLKCTWTVCAWSEPNFRSQELLVQLSHVWPQWTLAQQLSNIIVQKTNQLLRNSCEMYMLNLIILSYKTKCDVNFDNMGVKLDFYWDLCYYFDDEM